MYNPQRPQMVAGRIPEFLEGLKSEFESLAHDVNMFKMQRDDYERKLQAQLQELTNIQQTLYDLERNHTKIKQQYEEEIMRLRRQLELQGSSALPPTPSPVPTPSPSPLQPNVVVVPNLNRNPLSNAPSAVEKGSLASPLQTVSSNTKRTRESEQFYPLTGSQPNGAGSFPPLPLSQMSEAAKKSHPMETSSTDSVEEKNPRRGSEHKEESSSTGKKTTTPEDGADWIVGYNPNAQTNISVDLLHTFEHSSVVCCVKFSNDGKWLATGCNKVAQVFDIETGDKIHSFTEEAAKDGDLYIRSVCFSPDNKYLAAGAEDKTVKVWDVDQKRLHHTFVGHELDIYSLDFSKDGRFIVSGSGDQRAKIWDLEKGECLFTLGSEEVGPKDGITSVAWSPDGRLVAAGSLDRIVRLWDAHTGFFLERYEGHTDSVYSVAFSPDGKSLASGSLDKTLKVWDLTGSRNRSRCRSTFTGHKDFVLSVAFSPDGNWLISGSKDRTVQFWDPRSAITHLMLQGHKNSVISVAVSPSGRHFATGSGDHRARAWKYE